MDRIAPRHSGRMGVCPRAILAVLCMLGSLAAAAPVDIVDVSRPSLRVYTDRDGIPQNSIENIAVDRTGYLWVATQDGLARYNGSTWTHLALPDAKASQWARGLLPARDGSLWVGRQLDGLCRLKDGQWTTYGTDQGLPKGPVMQILERQDGSLLAATARGVLRLEGGRWSPLSPAEERLRCQVNVLAENLDAAGQPVLWAGTEQGLGRLQAGTWTWSGTREGLPSLSVTSVFQSAPDHVWAGTALGLAEWDGRTWKVRKGIPPNIISRLVEAQEPGGARVLWVATGQGLARLEGEHTRIFDCRSGLPNQMVRSLLVTRSPEGIRTVWAGTFGGLVRMTSGTWVTLDSHSGLTDNVCFHVEELPETGQWLLSTLGGGLARFGDGRWVDIGKAGFKSRQVFATLTSQEPSGPVTWVGTMGDGLQRLQGGRWARMGAGEGFTDSWVYTLKETREPDGRSLLWAGTRSGIARLDRNHWTHFGEAQGVPRLAVMGFAQTQTGGQTRQWAASRGGGVLSLEGDRWVARSEGLPHLWVMDLKAHTTATGGHQLWAATFGGLAWLDLDQPGARWQPITQEQLPGIPSNLFYQIQFDRLGRVYATSVRGVVRLTPGPAPGAWAVHLFNVGDGLPSNGCTQGSTLVDSQGRIWTGTVAGAAMFDPAEEKADHTSKPLVLEKILVGGRERAPGHALELSWRGGELQFHYALLSYYREADTQFRTQLVGLEKEPSAWGPDLKRTYPTLPGGSFVFRVWARDFAGNETGPVEVRFIVNPPPWMRWWAMAGYLLLLGAAVQMVTRWRLRAVQARNEELEARVKERTLELEVMDAIVQSLNRQMDLKGLFQELLDNGHLLFPQADRITLLLRAEDHTTFKVEAARSSLPGEEAAICALSLPADEAVARYTSLGQELRKGVYLIQDFASRPGEDRMGGLARPASMLAMTLQSESDLEGFLVLDHLTNAHGFSQSDEYRLSRFREHVLSAIAKAKTLARLEKVNLALQEANMLDPMTGLKNRRFLALSMPEELARVHREWAGARRGDRSREVVNVDLVFFMVDLDHFKAVNDTYGHAAGDAVLQQASSALRGACRESDIVVRWGGEEFLIMARNTDRVSAPVMAQHLLNAIGDLAFDLGHGATLRKTCSIGFSAYPVRVEDPDASSWEDVVALADQCLYAAKRSGRNAWVGLLVNEPGIPLDHFAARAAAGAMTILTSFTDGRALDWQEES